MTDSKQITTIKCCLQKYLICKDLAPFLDHLVHTYSQIFRRGSLILNACLLNSIPNIHDIPNLNDQLFYLKCLVTGLELCKPKRDFPQLTSLMETYNNYFYHIPRMTGDSDLLNYLARKLKTSMLNHLKDHFFSKQLRMIRIFISNLKLAKKIQSIINNHIPPDPTFLQQFSSDYQNWIFDQKRLLQSYQLDSIINILQGYKPSKNNIIEPIPGQQKINDTWLRQHLRGALAYTHYMQLQFELHNKKNFSLRPLWIFGLILFL